MSTRTHDGTILLGDHASVPGFELASGPELICALALLPTVAPDPFASWVVKPAARTIGYLRAVETARGGEPHTRRQAVIWAFPHARDAVESAARSAGIEALRGIVQSVTREMSTTWAPVNGIIVGHGDAASAAHVVDFLSSPVGGFTAGSTFNLITESSANR